MKKILLIASVCFILPIVLFVFLGKPSKKTITTPFFPTPTAFPTRTTVAVQKNTIDYAPNTASNLINKIEHPSLSPEAQEIKNALKKRAEQNEGTLLVSPALTVSYIFALNFIQVEIMTDDIVSAKKSVVAWLTSQGLDEKSICDLPVMFYLSAEVKERVKETVREFSYLPEGCE